jgi:hypothetical protein
MKLIEKLVVKRCFLTIESHEISIAAKNDKLGLISRKQNIARLDFTRYIKKSKSLNQLQWWTFNVNLTLNR